MNVLVCAMMSPHKRGEVSIPVEPRRHCVLETVERAALISQFLRAASVTMRREYWCEGK
jgi:hypothetical protein